MMTSPALKGPEDPILDSDGETAGTLLNFWSWAYSDPLDNAARGVFAEYLVALATGSTGESRKDWAAYDLTTPAGIALEVKSSAYVQTWPQKKPSEIRFSTYEAQGWDPLTNEYSSTPARSADIYVFCVLNHLDRNTVNPLDTRQWDFYVTTSKRLNETIGRQKSIGLNPLLTRVQPVKTTFSELDDAIAEAAASLPARRETRILE
ncbi:hypothetical protein [Corynebacterium sp. UBA2622]|uniref:hypothetical protein n=1 Tax=Corynebacterium sp. UBA2622 TaxID=1946393 RepID=UPI0025C34327|nr:hypothetical protein [Corynebacterium sp. UBA2622]